MFFDVCIYSLCHLLCVRGRKFKTYCGGNALRKVVEMAIGLSHALPVHHRSVTLQLAAKNHCHTYLKTWHILTFWITSSAG